MPRRASLIVFLGLAVSLVLVTGISAGAAPGDIREKRDEVASAQDRLANIRMEVSAAQAAYNNSLYEMNQLNGQIAQATEDLKASKKRLAEAQADLEERASQVYKSGNVAFMDVLVGVDDFSEFATRLDLWVRLLGQERAKVEAVEKAKNELAARKRELTDQREQRVAAVEKAIEQRERAEEAEKEAEEYLASLNADLRAEIQARQDRQAELAASKYEEVAPDEPTPMPEVEVEQVEQIPVQQPDLQDEQAAAERAAAAAAAARRAERLAEQRAAERAAAREAAEQAAAEQAAAERAAAREARQEARAAAEREAELAAQRAAERRAEREAAEREAELAAQQAAAERAAAQQAADEREAARLAAQRRAELAAEREAELAAQRAAERQAEREAAEASASASAAAQEETTTGSASASAAPVGGGGATGSGTSVISEGQKYLGTPYVLGGMESCVPYEMMDCSCFTMTVYSQFGVALPDSPGGQMGYGSQVSGSPMAGDLLFWSEDGSGVITHVGIAMGDGTAIHASTYTGNVTQGTPIDAIPGYVGARRLL